MENDVFKTNPVFQNLSPEKLSFLMNFANSKKPTERHDAISARHALLCQKAEYPVHKA